MSNVFFEMGNIQGYSDSEELFTKDIKKDDELSYDYGFSFDEDFQNYPCRCGSKDCAKYIIREGSRWRIKKSKLYKSHK